MAYTWDEETMGFMTGGGPAEEEQRAAIIAGAEFLDAVYADGVPPPEFGGSTFCLPKNDLAENMYLVVGAKLTSKSTELRRMISTAIRSAQYVHANGGGDAGWEAFKLITPDARMRAAKAKKQA